MVIEFSSQPIDLASIV